MSHAENLLPKVKENLVLQHDKDDKLLRHYITAALSYAEGYQKRRYKRAKLPPVTEQAVIILATHFYESRDGATGGFFSNFVGAPNNIWATIHRLLALEKEWQV